MPKHAISLANLGVVIANDSDPAFGSLRGHTTSPRTCFTLVSRDSRRLSVMEKGANFRDMWTGYINLVLNTHCGGDHGCEFIA